MQRLLRQDACLLVVCGWLATELLHTFSGLLHIVPFGHGFVAFGILQGPCCMRARREGPYKWLKRMNMLALCGGRVARGALCRSPRRARTLEMAPVHARAGPALHVALCAGCLEGLERIWCLHK